MAKPHKTIPPSCGGILRSSLPCPAVTIPQSAALTAPFAQGSYGRGSIRRQPLCTRVPWSGEHTPTAFFHKRAMGGGAYADSFFPQESHGWGAVACPLSCLPFPKGENQPSSPPCAKGGMEGGIGCSVFDSSYRNPTFLSPPVLCATSPFQKGRQGGRRAPICKPRPAAVPRGGVHDIIYLFPSNSRARSARETFFNSFSIARCTSAR